MAWNRHRQLQWLGSEWESNLCYCWPLIFWSCVVVQHNWANLTKSVRYSACLPEKQVDNPTAFQCLWRQSQGSGELLQLKSLTVLITRNISNKNSSSPYNTPFCVYFDPVANIFPQIQWIKVCIDIKLENLNLAWIVYVKNCFSEMVVITRRMQHTHY